MVYIYLYGCGRLAKSKCRMSRVQSPIKDRVIPNTFKNVPVVRLFSIQYLKWNAGSFSISINTIFMTLLKIDLNM